MTNRTLTPDNDASVLAIASYLKDALNQRYLEIQTSLEFQYDGNEPVIRKIRQSPMTPMSQNVLADFPLLACYSAGSKGEALQERMVNIDFFLPDFADYERAPGIFRWVAVEVGRALGKLANCPTLLQTQQGLAYPLIFGQYLDEFRVTAPQSWMDQFPFIRMTTTFIETGV